MGENGRPGQYTIDKFFPGSNITYNVLAGGPASSYPKPNAFPTLTEWNASFVDLAGNDYGLKTSSVFYSAGQGGGVPGADIGTVNVAVAGVVLGLPADPGSSSDPPPSTNVPPVARPGGPYSVGVGAPLSADGSASTDADGTIAAYRWRWGDEIVLDAADVPAGDIKGTRWTRTPDSGASEGFALRNPDRGDAKLASATAAPASYVEVHFYAAAGVPYHLWFRMRADNDSVHKRLDVRAVQRRSRRAGTRGEPYRHDECVDPGTRRRQRGRRLGLGLERLKGTGRWRHQCISPHPACRRCGCNSARMDQLGSTGAELARLFVQTPRIHKSGRDSGRRSRQYEHGVFAHLCCGRPISIGVDGSRQCGSCSGCRNDRHGPLIAPDSESCLAGSLQPCAKCIPRPGSPQRSRRWRVSKCSPFSRLPG